VEPELEPLAAFKGEVEPHFGGFTRLQLEIHQRSYFAKRFLKRLNSTREATPPEEPEPEPFLEEPEPCQTGPYTVRPVFWYSFTSGFTTSIASRGPKYINDFYFH
jgi:hypothetical protein